jgi:hypothetical protein
LKTLTGLSGNPDWPIGCPANPAIQQYANDVLCHAILPGCYLLPATWMLAWSSSSASTRPWSPNTCSPILAMLPLCKHENNSGFSFTSTVQISHQKLPMDSQANSQPFLGKQLCYMLAEDFPFLLLSPNSPTKLGPCCTSTSWESCI